jgi:hypothetical protein
LHLLLLFSGSILGLHPPSCSSALSSRSASRGAVSTLHRGSPCSGHCVLAFALSWQCLKHVLGLQQWLFMHVPRWPEFALSCHLLQQRIDFMLGHILHPGGCQCLGLCGGGSSALPAGSTPAVSLARAGAAPTTSNTPHHSYALTFRTQHPPRPCPRVGCGSAFSTRHILMHEASGSDGVRVKLKRIEGLMGQHAARSPQMVGQCFATPRAAVLT